MRKRAILAMMLVVALALPAGCSHIEKDAEVDKQTVIIEVAGKTYTKQEVLSAADSYMNYQAYLYSRYGMAYDVTDAEHIASARQSAIESLVQEAVIAQKEAEYGISLTDAELAELQTTVDETYNGYVETVKTSYFADTTLTGEELDAAIAARMTELGYSTKEQMLESEKTNKAYEKLKAEIVKDVAVTDEEIQADYTSKLENAKASYASDLSSYASNVSSGSTVYYHPAGYRYVKNILRQISEEDSAKLSDLSSQITAKQTELDTATASVAELPEDAAADTEDQAKNRAALNTTVTTLTAEIADLQTQRDAAQEAAYAALQPTVDEIVAKLAEEGADFDAIMAEYGEDTGMQAEPAKTQGYLVCTGLTSMVAEFVNASMALEKVGDVSAPFRTSYGIHIVKYVGDLAEGEVPLDDVKGEIQSALLTSKQDALFNSTVEEWVKAANAKTYADRLN